MRQSLYVSWCALHFFLIVAGALRETLGLVGRGLTMVPVRLQSCASRAETLTAALLAQNLAPINPLRRAVATYLNVAGIERGYGYFAPSIPASYKLVFELHYPDGRTEYELPRVSSRAARLRLAALLDEIGRTRHDALREHFVKVLAASAWTRHPDVTSIRAVFGAIILPGINEFERGEREKYEFLYAYDFSRSD